MKHLTSNLLNTPVHGLNLEPHTLKDQLGESGDLLIFLRHLG